MKLTELLEQDREALMRALRAAPEPDAAVQTLERELERMLFAFNDAAPSQRQRESAAAMVGALRAALPLMACAGEARVWESAGRARGVRISVRTLIFLIAGCALCCVSAGLMLYHAMPPWLSLLPIAGGLALLAAGAALAKDRAGGAPERKIEVCTDWEKVYRTLHTAALTMDQTLDEAIAAERWEQRRRNESEAALSPEETELMAALLEARYSGDGEYALEKLDAVEHYLRAKGVEPVAYDEAHAQLFDRMPGARSATLCPALVQGAHLLRRGTATVPER